MLFNEKGLTYERDREKFIIGTTTMVRQNVEIIGGKKGIIKEIRTGADKTTASKETEIDVEIQDVGVRTLSPKQIISFLKY